MKNLSSIKFYNSFAPYYGGKTKNRRRYREAIDNLIVNSGIETNVFLDVGSADGKRAVKLASKLRPEKLFLIDNSPKMFKFYLKDVKNSILVDISTAKLDKKINADVITCLWNVLGHIENQRSFENALINMQDMLSNGGSLFLDVNNRYNYVNYGIWNVLKNLLKDIFFYKWSNGNFKVSVKLGYNRIHCYVHIFNPFELFFTVKRLGFKVKKILFVDYDTGKLSKNPFKGQMYLQLVKQ